MVGRDRDISTKITLITSWSTVRAYMEMDFEIIEWKNVFKDQQLTRTRRQNSSTSLQKTKRHGKQSSSSTEWADVRKAYAVRLNEMQNVNPVLRGLLNQYDTLLQGSGRQYQQSLLLQPLPSTKPNVSSTPAVSNTSSGIALASGAPASFTFVAQSSLGFKTINNTSQTISAELPIPAAGMATTSAASSCKPPALVFQGSSKIAPSQAMTVAPAISKPSFTEPQRKNLFGWPTFQNSGTSTNPDVVTKTAGQSLSSSKVFGIPSWTQPEQVKKPAKQLPSSSNTFGMPSWTQPEPFEKPTKQSTSSSAMFGMPSWTGLFVAGKYAKQPHPVPKSLTMPSWTRAAFASSLPATSTLDIIAGKSWAEQKKIWAAVHARALPWSNTSQTLPKLNMPSHQTDFFSGPAPKTSEASACQRILPEASTTPDLSTSVLPETTEVAIKQGNVSIPNLLGSQAHVSLGTVSRTPEISASQQTLPDNFTATSLSAFHLLRAIQAAAPQQNVFRPNMPESQAHPLSGSTLKPPSISACHQTVPEVAEGVSLPASRIPKPVGPDPLEGSSKYQPHGAAARADTKTNDMDLSKDMPTNHVLQDLDTVLLRIDGRIVHLYEPIDLTQSMGVFFSRVGKKHGFTSETAEMLYQGKAVLRYQLPREAGVRSLTTVDIMRREAKKNADCSDGKDANTPIVID